VPSLRLGKSNWAAKAVGDLVILETGAIPRSAVQGLTPKAIETIWMGPAQNGGHRSDEIRLPQVIDAMVKYVRENGSQLAAGTVARTFLYRLCEEQPFGDGNKRTGLIIATDLMNAAGYRLTRPDEEVWRYLNLFAKNHPGEADLVRWFGDIFRQVESPIEGGERFT
jgi:hypothetical protein